MEDVQRLFGEALIKKGYTFEVKYLRAVRDWRRACDEQGLSDSQCSQFNKNFLDYILDDLMPWHRDSGERDFTLLEVVEGWPHFRGFCCLRHFSGSILVDVINDTCQAQIIVLVVKVSVFDMQEVQMYMYKDLHCIAEICISNIRGFSRETLVAVIARENGKDVIVENMTFHLSTLVRALQMTLNAFFCA